MEEIIKWMDENNVKYVVLFNGEKPNSNLVYLSGFTGGGALVIPSEKNPYLYVPEMESEKAKKESEFEVVVAKNKLFKTLEEGKIGLDFESMSHKEVEALKKEYGKEIVDISEQVKDMRKVKNQNEIEILREACKITDEIFENLVSEWNFKREDEIISFLFKETKSRGCEFAFDPIVASGKNASVPHHLESGELQKGFCVIDFGVKYRNYCSDITRTFYIGEPSEEEKELYEKVLRLQNGILDKAKEEVSFFELHNEVKNALGENFIHALGHGIGIDVHEMPFVSRDGNDILKENMTIAIEPGYYVENEKGIRIEDSLVVGKEKSEILTFFNKELICIPAPKTF